jgi:hypothetical protein
VSRFRTVRVGDDEFAVVRADVSGGCEATPIPFLQRRGAPLSAATLQRVDALSRRYSTGYDNRHVFFRLEAGELSALPPAARGPGGADPFRSRTRTQREVDELDEADVGDLHSGALLAAAQERHRAETAEHDASPHAAFFRRAREAAAELPHPEPPDLLLRRAAARPLGERPPAGFVFGCGGASCGPNVMGRAGDACCTDFLPQGRVGAPEGDAGTLNTCACIVEGKRLMAWRTGRPWDPAPNYDASGRIADLNSIKRPIFECNAACACAANAATFAACRNRVVQKGVRVEIAIRDTGSRGLGIFYVGRERLEPGSFVMVYSGELV